MSTQVKVTNQLASHYKHSPTFYKQSTKKRPSGIELTPKAFKQEQVDMSTQVKVTNQLASHYKHSPTFYKQSTKKRPSGIELTPKAFK